MEAIDYLDWIVHLTKLHFLDDLTCKVVCFRMKELLIREPNLLELQAPITIVGDIHGQFYDLLHIFKLTQDDSILLGSGSLTQKYLFLGDYVDRGHFSVEVIELLFLLKLKFPDDIYIIRGNHESRQASFMYGFMEECKRKYGNYSVWKLICDVFDYLPIAARISNGTNNIFCVHGGISPSLLDIKHIDSINRCREVPQSGVVCDLLWSDPEPSLKQDHGLFTLNSRGCGCLFGSVATDIFCHHNDVELIVRSHQLAREGYQFFFEHNNLLIVWSAPNYCYREGNLATIFMIDHEFRQKLVQYDSQKEPEEYRKYELGRDLS